MLFLLFQLGGDRYAIEAAHVIEVLPLVDIKKIALAGRGIAGVFNYRGAAVPVIDLAAAALDRPSQLRLSTRLVIVEYGAGRRPLALMAEKATETLRREPGDFRPAGVTAEAARYLGPVTTGPDGQLIQRVEVDELLPADVRDALFREAAAVVLA